MLAHRLAGNWLASDGFTGECFIRLAELDALEAAGDLPAALVEPWRTRFLARADHVAILSHRVRAAS